MDVDDFCRKLWGGMDPSEILNNLEYGEPLNLSHREDTEPTDPNPPAAVSSEAVAAEVENQRATLGLGEPWVFCPGDNAVEGANNEQTEPLPSAAGLAAAQAQSPLFPDFYLGTITAEKEAMANLDREFESQNAIEVYFSNSDQQPGVEHTADDRNRADNNFHEHGSNDLADSRVSGIHRGDQRAGDTETVVSSQLFSTQSYNPGKDELDRFRNQEHSLINHKSSQGAPSSTLPEVIGDEDEAQSTSANIDGEELEPRVGLEFCSAEAVLDFYSKYAQQKGFRVRKGKPIRSRSNTITGKYFLCSCEGHKSQKQIEKSTQYKRRNTRTGCEAQIKCVVRDEKWKILKVILEHNHSLEGCLAVTHGRAEDSRSRSTMAHSTDKIVDEIRRVGEQALVSDVDGSDVSRGTWKNHPMLEPKDTQDLFEHFEDRQIEDPSFFHTTQEKAASGMANYFWRDSRSKIDYEHFGDVLVLDTRTEVKKYGMICAVFWGFNNHRQRIIFGCAFLVDQTVDSFNWLLRGFVKAMSRHKPKTIITEVSEEIADALRVVMPETSHCFPFWSLLNGFEKNLPAMSDQASAKELFMKCVYEVHSWEEFEKNWNYFVGSYELHENRWFASLSEMREKRSPASTKNAFLFGLISIQENEADRAIFGDLSRKTMTLSQCAQWCEKMAKGMRRKEFLEDKRCEKISGLQFDNPVETEAEHLYTKPIFRMFREEARFVLSLSIEKIGDKGTLREFRLTKQGSVKEEDTVTYDSSDSTLVCTCGKFNSVGILCVHALKVLNTENIFNIPSRYFLKRWTKTAKDSLPVDTTSTGTARDRGPDELFMIEFVRQASHVAHMSVNKERKRKAMAIIKVALEDIAKVPKTEEVKVALDNSDGNDDMDQTTWNYAPRSQVEQDEVAKSGMRCSRVKRKV